VPDYYFTGSKLVHPISVYREAYCKAGKDMKIGRIFKYKTVIAGEARRKF
jgi:hypothetical protein